MVFLSNLPSSIHHDLLLPYVKKYGIIVDLYIYPNDSGILEALVEFAKADSVRRFVLDGPFKISDVVIVPQRCRPETLKWKFGNSESRDTVYVSNLPGDVNKILIRQIFAEVFYSYNVVWEDKGYPTSVQTKVRICVFAVRNRG